MKIHPYQFSFRNTLPKTIAHLHVQSTSHNSDHSGLADFVRIRENPDYVETFLVLHFIRKLIGLSNSVRNIQKSG